MPGPLLFDKSFATLQKVLELRQKRQQVIASNIANAETPGYHPRRLEFESELQSALTTKGGIKRTRPRHLGSGGDVSSVTGRVRTEMDAVNVDQEMVTLAENQILYEAAVQMLNKKIGLLKYVAQDGR
ncbi:flagellar basal-body rod protein FlgB [Geothermobacter ehrlichii]|uniref:Flagellar basal body rod protein FlgB n=1 Tax=Geothermobacter ehrlichii TaxID=213224 RepID=A0A5D3WM17_9BACT|nr:flagellar basal body rod protein FlgB [Geothermobacter ehrlichii]TYP00216.1 flagellar basal-body rod protein FlgB [Geothermobacter ehrlichii]